MSCIREYLQTNMHEVPDMEALITGCVRDLDVGRDSVVRMLRKLRPFGEAQDSPGDDEPIVSGATGGFSLANRTLLATKPTDVWKARFYALRKGMGFTIEHLADQWGNSIDTIRSKAKRFGALRYVEDRDAPGQYIACVVHPETPKGR